MATHTQVHASRPVSFVAMSFLATFATTVAVRADGAPPQLLAAVDLRAEWLLPPALGVPAQPLLSFAPTAGVSGRSGWTLSAFSITVRSVVGGAVAPGTPAWDSGVMPASPFADPAVGVRVGVPLAACQTFEWEAVYWCNSTTGVTAGSATATARFDTAVVNESAWRGAQWLGAGHAEFRAFVSAFAHPCVSCLRTLFPSWGVVPTRGHYNTRVKRPRSRMTRVMRNGTCQRKTSSPAPTGLGRGRLYRSTGARIRCVSGGNSADCRWVGGGQRSDRGSRVA